MLLEIPMFTTRQGYEIACFLAIIVSMGQNTSSPSSEGGGPHAARDWAAVGASPSIAASSARRSRMAELAATGRYAPVITEGGGIVHVLGVLPGSARAAEDAYDLIAETRPQWVYVDEPPEILAALREEVEAGRVGKGFKPGEDAVRFTWRRGAGLGASIRVRQALADNEMFALLGAEFYAPQKAAICAALRTAPEPLAAASATAGEVGDHKANAEILPYPVSIKGTFFCYERRDQYIGAVFGDEHGAFSASAHAIVVPFGFPALPIEGVEPLVSLEATLPPERGELTRREVAELRRANLGRVERVWATINAESADVMKQLEKMAEAPEVGDYKAQLVENVEVAKACTKAIAHTLHSAADSLAPGQSGVAIVNIGTMRPLSRCWAEPADPGVLFPPAKLTVLNGVSSTLALAAVGGVGYGYSRFFRRFPKSAVATGLVLALPVLGMATSVVYKEGTTIGPYMRFQLAKPTAVASKPTAGAGVPRV